MAAWIFGGNVSRTKWEFEIWHKGVTRVAEIAHLMYGIHGRLTRNGVYQLDFNMDTQRFHDFCKSINEHPNSVLENLLTDIKIKRNGAYLYGVYLVEDPPNFNQNNSTMQLFCDGYLNLLQDRYVTPPSPFVGVESTTLAWNLIDLTQDQDRGDLGITLGPQQYTTGVARDRSDYVDQNVKEGIINLTNLQNGNFDFEIDHLRRFNTYEALGDNRPDIRIVYPADQRRGVGATSMGLTRTGQPMFNRIIAYGKGFGEEALRYVADDVASQLKYGMIKERKMIWNEISDLATLIDHAEGELAKQKEQLILPNFNVSGDHFDLNDIKLGSRIFVEQTKFAKYHMNGMFRIEEIEFWLDENMAEDIKITVDNFGL